MNKEVIVITEDELNNRSSFSEALDKTYDHTHYAITKVGTIQTLLFGLIGEIKDSQEPADLIKSIESIIDVSSQITSEVRAAQNYLIATRRMLAL